MMVYNGSITKTQLSHQSTVSRDRLNDLQKRRKGRIRTLQNLQPAGVRAWIPFQTSDNVEPASY